MLRRKEKEARGEREGEGGKKKGREEVGTE